MKRIFEFYAGGQASGKTYQLRKRVEELAQKKSITSVFVCDRIGEYEDLGVVCRKLADYYQHEHIPRIVIFSLGLDVTAYEPVFDEAIDQGGCVIVIDEAHEFAPGGSAWRGAESLHRVVLAGRHIRNCQNKICQTHLVIATQYPRQCHHSMWSQAETIKASILRGDLASDWIRGNFGKPAAETNARLALHQFQTLRPEKNATE